MLLVNIQSEKFKGSEKLEDLPSVNEIIVEFEPGFSWYFTLVFH